MRKGKVINVTIDIAAQATQFNNIIEQSKKSLNSLSLSPKMDNTKLKGFQGELNKIQNKLETLQTNFAAGLRSPAAFAKAGADINGLYQQYANFVNKVQGLNIDVKQIFPDTEDVREIITELTKETEKQAELMGKKLGKGIDKGLDSAMAEAASTGNKDLIKRLEKEAKKANTDANRSNISRAAAIGKKYGTNAAGASAAIEKELLTYRQMSEVDQRAYRGKTGRTIDTMKADLSTAKKYDAYTQKQSNISTSSQEYQKQATEIQQLTQAINELTTKLQQLAGPTQDAAEQGLNQIAQSADQAETQIREMGNEVDKGATSFDKMSKKVGQLSQLKSYIGYMFSITSVVMKTGQAIRNAINDVKELDKQLNEISIVTGKTMDELWSGFGKLNSAAQKYGVTTGDVVSVQKLYYQQGRSVAEVNELTGETLAFAKISGLEFADATEYMTAALNAFKIEAKDASIVTDTYAALSAKAAVDAKEVAVAMSKVASLAAASNADLQDTSAYLTKIIETTREAPETAGTALKTVIARFTAVNKLTEDQAELLDEDYNFNNIEKALKTVGIAVKDSTGQMRGFTDIIGELGPKWDKLTSNQQHYIATQAAGARQQSRFIALMDDWERTEELMGVAADSAGTGAKQLELSMDSIDSKLNQLKASWQSFYGSLTSSNIAKFVIDLGNNVLKLLNSIGEMPIWLSAIVVPMLTILLQQIVNWAIKFGKTFAGAFMGAYNTTKEAAVKKETIEEVADYYKRGYSAGVAFAKGKAAGEKAGEVAEDVGKVATDVAGDVVTKTGAGALTGAVGTGAGAKLGGLAGTVMKWIVGVLPYAAIAAAVFGAIWGTAKLNQYFQNKDNKEAGSKVGSAQNKANEALEKQQALTKSYTRALELQRKGLAKTEEETEEYQKLLGELQIQYPGIIKKTEEGLLELTEQSEAFIETQKRVNSINLENAQKDVLYNADKAFAVGKYATTEANNINEELKSVFSILSEKTDDEIKELGLIGTKLNPENFNKLAEQGLSYEAVDEALGWRFDNWAFSTFTADQYNDIVQEFARLTEEQNSLTLDVNASSLFQTGDGKRVLALLNALNQQAGTNIVGELVEANDYSAIMSEQVGQIAQNIQATRGVNFSEQIVDLMQEEAVSLMSQNMTITALNEPEQNQIAKELDSILASLIEDIKKDNISGISSTNSEAASNFIEAIRNTPNLTSEDVYELLTKNSIGDGWNSPYFLAYEKFMGANPNLPTDDALFGAFWATEQAEQIKELQKSIAQEIKKQNQTNIESYAGMDSSTRSHFENQISAMSNMSLDALNKFKLSEEALNNEAENYQKTLFERAKANNEKILTDYKSTIEALSGDTIQGLDKLSSETLNKFAELTKIMASKYAPEAVKGFSNAYLDFYNTALSGNAQLSSAFAEVDFFNTESIAKFAAKAKTQINGTAEAYDKFVELVNNSSSVLDRDFENLTTAISTATTSVKNLKEELELLQKGFDEGLDIDEMGKLLSKYPDLLDIENMIPTADGMKISNVNANKVRDSILSRQMEEYQNKYWLNNAHIKGYWEAFKTQAQLAAEDIDKMKVYSTLSDGEKDEIDKLIEGKGLTSDWARLQELQQTLPLYEKMYTYVSQIDFTYEARKKKFQNEIDQLETILSLLEKINEYADIDGLINSLTNKLDRLDFRIEFSSNTDNLAESIKDKFSTLGNLVNANLAKAQQATENTAKRRQALEQGEFSKYVKFDEDGNLLRDEAGLAAWAESIGKMDISTESNKDKAEQEKKRFELFMDSLDAYEEEKELINECTAAAEDYTKQIEDFDKELHQNVVDLEDKFRELMIKRDEEAVEALEKRYDAMKEADQDYLDSVRNAIDEERRLRDQDKAYDDVEKMERQLELLRMSGGSATRIQELEQRIADARQDINDTEIDNKLAAMEDDANKRAGNYDEEVQYQQSVLEAKKENQIAYNAEIAALMKQDKETIMNTWKTLDQEFVNSTETNKFLLEQEMEAMVNKGKASKDLLAEGPEAYIPTIRQAYLDVKEAIGEDGNAMIAFGNTIAQTKGGAINGIGEIKTAYSGVYDMIGLTIEHSETLMDKLSGVVSYIKNNAKYLDTGMGNYDVTLQNLSGGQLGNVEKQFNTEKGIGQYGNAESWYKVNGLWYTGSQLVNSNIKEGEQAVIKTGQTGLSDEAHTELLLQRFYAEQYRDGVANKSFTSTTAEAQATRGLNLIPISPSDGTKIQTYKSPNSLDTYNNKWTSAEIADSAWFAGVQNNYARIRDDALDKDYYILLTDFMKYFNVGFIQNLKGYSSGGIVDFTGPAMVHGTPTKPEAFLSAQDTTLIASLRDVLRLNHSFGSLADTPIQKNGDTYYEIHINIDELGDGYSVDDMVEELEERILQATGNKSVIKVK